MRAFRSVLLSLWMIAARGASAFNPYDLTPSERRMCVQAMRQVFGKSEAAPVSALSPTADQVRARYPAYRPLTDGDGLAPRVHQALQGLLKDYAAEAKPLPAILLPDRQAISEKADRFRERWAQARRQGPTWPEFPRVDTRPIDNDWFRTHFSDAFFIHLGGQDWIFRRLLSDESNLLTCRYSADRLNELLGLDSSSHSFFAVVNGKRGLLSSYVPGLQPLPYDPDHNEDLQGHLADLMARGRLTEASLSEAYAYLFLVNNHDVHSANFGIDERGVLRVFDHDVAWEPALPSFNRDVIRAGALGHDLPPRYTARFAKALRELSPATIARELSPYLLREEIEALLLRRELVLKDLELRGADALFP